MIHIRFAILIYIVGLLLFLTLNPQSITQESQFLEKNDTPSPGNKFLLLLWPEEGGMLQEASGQESLLNAFNNAWYDNHLPSYTGMSLEIHLPQSQSLYSFAHMIKNTWPECIEGDRWFIENEINQTQFPFLDQRKYVPILMRSTQRYSAELIFRSRATQWEGSLGVVHSDYEIGGKLQLEEWQSKSNSQNPWIAFHSTDEVLRQFFIGSCNAAAVPQGALERFLEKYNKEKFAQRLQRIELETQGFATTFFLRKDLYDDPLMRTLITESWLRNHFSGQLIPLPSAWPFTGEDMIQNTFNN